MSKDNTLIFQDFARKAKERIEEKKKKRTKRLYVKDLDLTLTIRGISDEEYEEVSDREDLSDVERDKYLIYYVCPELQEASKAMVEEKILQENTRYKITDMFRAVDRRAICQEILTLSGLMGESSVEEAKEKISETEEVKN